METRQSTPGQASGDDPAQFLRELRQLRDGAGLGPAELAARAHYPYDLIRAAEAGPALPDLPVLSAYVRGCGGGTEEWEERWRSLTSAQTLPLMGARPAGTSTAAAELPALRASASGWDGVLVSERHRSSHSSVVPPQPLTNAESTGRSGSAGPTSAALMESYG